MGDKTFFKHVFLVALGIVLINLIPIFLFIPSENTVVSIHDGDTIHVRLDNKDVKIRLALIDAPELKQNYGFKSRDALFKKIYGKQVHLDLESHKDVHNRPLAVIFLNNRNINEEMVEEGYAWDYHQYSHSKKLAELQQNAKAHKLGLWKDANPVPPWEFRKTKK